MFKDLREVQVANELNYDVIIVGAGAAGLAIAMEFVGSPLRIAVIESGGLEYEAETQDLYHGESVGLPYAPLDSSRLRFFGGTTNHWAGYCSSLVSHNFDPLPWIPHSGWPISLDDLVPYYTRARDRMGMEERGWSPKGTWDAAVVTEDFGDPAVLLDPAAVEHRAYVIKAVRMAEEFHDALASSETITVYLNANLKDIRTNDTATEVTGLDVRTLDSRAFTFHARHYVIAAGGIENARLLLNSTTTQTEGLGNGNDLVGRFFSDHLDVSAGTITPVDRGQELGLYKRRPFGRDSEAVLFHDLTFEIQKTEQLTSGGVQFRPVGVQSAGVRALRTMVRDLTDGSGLDDMARHVGNVISSAGDITNFSAEYLWHGRPPLERIDVTFHIDSAPEPTSRVQLSQETDALGMRRVVLDWRLSEIDIRTIRWMDDWLAIEAAKTGLGRFRSDIDPADIEASVIWHYHNIGTTRMAHDPSQGVVDADCRVHGIANLFVAGSSVFATCGAGSPTFSIVALAIRLADHLKKELEA